SLKTTPTPTIYTLSLHDALPIFREIAVVQEQPHAVNVRIDIKMIDAGGVEGARPPDYSVNLVAFFQQQIGQITSILAGDPGDQGALHLASGIKSNRAREQIIVGDGRALSRPKTFE